MEIWMKINRRKQKEKQKENTNIKSYNSITNLTERLHQ